MPCVLRTLCTFNYEDNANLLGIFRYDPRVLVETRVWSPVFQSGFCEICDVPTVESKAFFARLATWEFISQRLTLSDGDGIARWSHAIVSVNGDINRVLRIEARIVRGEGRAGFNSSSPLYQASKAKDE